MTSPIPRSTLAASLALLMLLFTACGGEKSPPNGEKKAENDVPPPEGSPQLEEAALLPQKVLLEIDRMQGTTPVQMTQTLNNQVVSLAGIYSPAGLALRIVPDQDNIPRQSKVRLADLHALMTTGRSVTANAGELKVYMLVVTEDDEDADTLGIMFDFGENDPNDVPREGFAVFETAHQNMAAGVVPEVLLTAAHEFAHVFNLHHTDWDGVSFEQSSTIEGYSFTDTVVWSLSAASLAHFKGPSCPRELILPGAGSLPFGLITQSHAGQHKNSPHESYDILPGNVSALRRGTSVTRSTAVKSRLAHEAARDATASSPLRLTLQAPKNDYVVGEAVTLTAALKNVGNEARKVVPLLEPEYRFLSISIRGPGDTEFRPYFAPVVRDSRKGVATVLAPDETLFGEARVFFGSDGWTFETPGEYLIQSSFPADAEFSNDVILSEPVSLKISAPTTEPAARAVKLLQRADGKSLGMQQGLYLYMSGGDHLDLAKRNLRQLTREVPQAPQAAAAKLALANQALVPTIDPQQRTKPQPRLDEAQRLLREAAQDPGISSATLVRVQGRLIEELEKVGRTSEANAARTDLNRELARRQDSRNLNRRDIERRLQ